MLNGLDLFSGIGGISLALQPWVRTVCYVENEPYAQPVLQARIADGRLDDAPIWDDVRTFDPEPWRGLVDIVAGGFPCQDISTAGRGAGLAGERSGLFREIVRIAGDLRPQLVYLENVAAITAPGRGGWDVVGALAALGYDCRWGVLSAFDVGAPHRRDRWWCLAHAAGERPGEARELRRDEPAQWAAGGGESVAHAAGARQHAGGCGTGGQARDVARGPGLDGLGADVPQPGGAGLGLGQGPHAQWAHPATAGSGFWSAEPELGGGPDGLSAGLDGDIDGTSKNEGPDQALQGVRVYPHAEANQQQTGRPIDIQAPGLLQPGVHGGGLCQRCAVAQGHIPLEGTAPARELLRILWGDHEPARPSRRWDAQQQLAREHQDLVRELSRHAPPPCAACWADGSYEDGVSRVASNVPARVDRLRGLGNSVVPACAREAFARLLTGRET